MKIVSIHLTLVSFLLVGILLRFNVQNTQFSENFNIAENEFEISNSEATHNQNYRVQKVVIDPGHGGHDTGCIRGHSNEKHLTLSIAKKLGVHFEEKFPEIEVIFTRTKDVGVKLKTRSDIANNANADLFISIHCNSMKGNDHNWINGSETYVLGLKTKKENLAIVKRENASILLEDGYEENYEDFDENSPEAHIMFSHYQNEFLDKSILFAQKVEKQFKKIIKSRGVKQANFHVLREISMPGVLIETAYMSNASDKKFLESEIGQHKIANAIITAFSQYKNEVENHGIQQARVERVSQAKTTDSNATTFRIQLAASKTKLNLQTPKWDRIENLTFDKTDAWYRYYSGPYDTYESALKMRRKCAEIGFDRAFITGYRNGKKVKLDKSLLK